MIKFRNWKYMDGVQKGLTVIAVIVFVGALTMFVIEITNLRFSQVLLNTVTMALMYVAAWSAFDQ